MIDDWGVFLTWPRGDGLLAVERLVWLPPGTTDDVARDFSEELFRYLSEPGYGIMCCGAISFDDAVFDGYINSIGRPYVANVRLRFGVPVREKCMLNDWIGITAKALIMRDRIELSV